MSQHVELRLATVSDAGAIARMSRDFIESGLGWSWRAARVAQKIRSDDNVVVVATMHRSIIGFAIMWFGEQEGRLNLFAVKPRWRRQGIGRRLVEWLERSALVAGVSVIYLEVRADNLGAQRFYRRLGYCAVQQVSGYYSGREPALRMARDLWEPVVKDPAGKRPTQRDG